VPGPGRHPRPPGPRHDRPDRHCRCPRLRWISGGRRPPLIL
jgi:hypothetical protein